MSVEQDVANIMDEYLQNLEKVSKKLLKSTARTTAQNLRNTSPRNTGEYANNWAFKEDKRSDAYIVYNKAPTYRLTHLLENGHIISNGFGTYGRYNGVKHIAPAEKKGIDQLVSGLEAEL